MRFHGCEYGVPTYLVAAGLVPFWSSLHFRCLINICRRPQSRGSCLALVQPIQNSARTLIHCRCDCDAPYSGFTLHRPPTKTLHHAHGSYSVYIVTFFRSISPDDYLFSRIWKFVFDRRSNCIRTCMCTRAWCADTARMATIKINVILSLEAAVASSCERELSAYCTDIVLCSFLSLQCLR